MKGLYIHIPFCVKKCKYCDFISFTAGDKEAYITALCRELDAYKGEEIDTVFIGGGTPTSLPNELIKRLFLHIRNTFTIKTDAEWSVEANPKTVDGEKLMLLRDLGANRISVGVQSFSDNELQKIGRVHTAKEAAETIELVKRYFDNVNIDLISALPEQSLSSFITTVDTAISLNPDHISCYSLILEEGTPLYNEHISSPLNIPDEETEREMYFKASEMLAKAGYNRYEISNFAKFGRECRHNLKYWHCDDYIGAGIAAHSLINGVRRENTTDMTEYMNGNYLKESVTLDISDKISEYIIMAFLLTEGISETKFQRKFGLNFKKEYNSQLARFEKLGLIEKTTIGYRLTDNGISVSNSVLCEFV